MEEKELTYQVLPLLVDQWKKLFYLRAETKITAAKYVKTI